MQWRRYRRDLRHRQRFSNLFDHPLPRHSTELRPDAPPPWSGSTEPAQMSTSPCPPTRPILPPGLALARLAKLRDGIAAVEMAILLPAFLTVLLGIVEFGRVFWTQSALQFAVEAAARCAAIGASACSSTSGTQSYAASQAYGLSIPSADFTVSQPSCGNQVSIAYSFKFVVPKLLPWTITLNAQSCHP